MDDYIKRHAEKTIKELGKGFKAVLVTGPRQAGKSTLLVHLNNKLEYVSFDDFVISKSYNDDPMSFFDIHKLPIILDEVQKKPESFTQIKNVIDKSTKKGQIYLSGSQSFVLMKNVTESLAGRIGIINLLPLSMREIYNINITDKFIPNKKLIRKLSLLKSVKRDIWKDIITGGMPELYGKNKVNPDKYFASYVVSYLEKDVRELSQVGNITKFYDFLVAIASMATGLLNIESLSDSLKINRKTCEHYLSILEASHIIYLLKPYHNNTIKRLVKTPKIYFTDTGLLSYLLGWKNKDNLKLGPLAGMFFENFVVSEIIKSFYNCGELNLPIYFYRDKDMKEIDLLIEENGVLYPIEIKKHATITLDDAKNFNVLKKIKNRKCAKGCIISSYDKIVYLSDDIINIPVFLV